MWTMTYIFLRLAKLCLAILAIISSATTSSEALTSGDFYTINNNYLGKISISGEITKMAQISALYNIDILTYNSADSNFYTIYNRILAKITPGGQLTEICELQVSFMDYDQFVDLCYNTADGNFYALNMNHLAKISPSGVLTEIRDLGAPYMDYDKFERLCYNSSDGNFYATNSNHLVKITPGGQLTEIRDLTSSVLYYDVFKCLCYNASDGNLYSINNNHLVKITTTGVVSEVGLLQSSSFEFDTLRNIAWVPSAASNPQPYKIGALKKMSSAASVAIDDAVVTAVNIEPGVVFVESANRTSGIKLLTSKTLTIGQRVKFSGTADKIDGEFQINSVLFDNDITNGTPLTPLGMTSKSINSATGLLVRYAGRVNTSKPTERTIYVDDGGNARDGVLADSHGIRVHIPTGAAVPQNNNMVVITGISRTEKAVLPAGGTVYLPCIWPRYPSDVRIVAP